MFMTYILQTTLGTDMFCIISHGIEKKPENILVLIKLLCYNFLYFHKLHIVVDIIEFYFRGDDGA